MIIPFRPRKPTSTRRMAVAAGGARSPLRLVRSRRWIDTRHLELGMYVLELDRPWADTPFEFQGFRLDSPELIAEVRLASNMALVETQKLATAPAGVRLRAITESV